jgi:hypothetical protein
MHTASLILSKLVVGTRTNINIKQYIFRNKQRDSSQLLADVLHQGQLRKQHNQLLLHAGLQLPLWWHDVAVTVVRRD